MLATVSLEVVKQREIITVKEARKLLGIKQKDLSDDGIEILIHKLYSIVRSSIILLD